MTRLILIAGIFCITSINASAQSILKLDLFTKVPTDIKNCGALYTYDTTTLAKKKYLLAVDQQNKGIATINGKVIQLTLGDTKLLNRNTNMMTYTGAGYTIKLAYKTDKQTKKLDLESGTIELSKGAQKVTYKIHGQSSCDESKQEGNG